MIDTTEEATGGSVSDLNACLIEIDNLEHVSSLATTLMLVYNIIRCEIPNSLILSVHIFRIVLAKYPIDLAQGYSLAINNLFSTVVVYLDYGALITKDVGIDAS